jgi:hypothetical protein
MQSITQVQYKALYSFLRKQKIVSTKYLPNRELSVPETAAYAAFFGRDNIEWELCDVRMRREWRAKYPFLFKVAHLP